jgi:hypothetical protein
VTQTGDRFPVLYSFRLPSGGRIRLTYDCTQVDEDRGKDLYVVRLDGWHDLEWPPGQAPDEQIVALLNALVGMRARIPKEASTGARLPMKYETLTREMRYFYN